MPSQKRRLELAKTAAEIHVEPFLEHKARNEEQRRRGERGLYPAEIVERHLSDALRTAVVVRAPQWRTRELFLLNICKDMTYWEKRTLNNIFGRRTLKDLRG